jgi:hypothetical protein
MMITGSPLAATSSGRRNLRPQSLAAALGTAVALGASGGANAFPPYRSTDAETAEARHIELRLGLGDFEREHGSTEVISPLLNANVGLPHGFELNSEFEYAPRSHRLADGALGAKWAAPVTEAVSGGVEALALVPVNRASSGVGVEAQVLATLRRKDRFLHLNAGGFHDPRGGSEDSGWRASALLEIPRGRSRIGFELSALGSNRNRRDVRAALGVIHALKRFDIRSGVQVGLTSGAPDVSASLWLSTSFRAWR